MSRADRLWIFVYIAGAILLTQIRINDKWDGALLVIWLVVGALSVYATPKKSGEDHD